MSQLATKTLRPGARGTVPPQAGPTATISHEAIARLTHQKWQKRGCPVGDEQRDWFEAEAELKAEQSGHRRSRS